MGRFAAALMRRANRDGNGRPCTGHGREVWPQAGGRAPARRTRRLWHDRSNRGWQAHLEVFPDRDWALVMLTNGDNGRHVIADVTRLIVR